MNGEEKSSQEGILKDVENGLKEGNTSTILHEKVIRKKNGINLVVRPIHISHSNTHSNDEVDDEEEKF